MLILRYVACLLLLAIVLASCGPDDDAWATLVPTAVGDDVGGDGISDESPRAESPESDNGIPPTWTPNPTAEAPPPPPTRAPDETYVVQPGDTLAEIAEQFGVDLQRLASANDIQNIDIIHAGEVLTIPR